MDSHEEQLVALISESTNRKILTILDEATQALSVTEIATRLGSQDTLVLRSADEDELEQLRISLHHDYLPRLDEAGLIEYDTDSNTATSSEYTAVHPDWHDITMIDELLSRFETGHEADQNAIGILEGRERVYDYSRTLADRAEDELFLIYTSEELLDEACLPHAQNAIDRGVSFHAGAQSQQTRAFFRECLPDATVWEPQLDWMSDQSEYPAISRLVFADRETVIVGLWTESDADGTGTETSTKTELAMVGEGATNPLVVLVRELLGPRLDHLDFQSDDFLETLPFES